MKYMKINVLYKYRSCNPMLAAAVAVALLTPFIYSGCETVFYKQSVGAIQRPLGIGDFPDPIPRPTVFWSLPPDLTQFGLPQATMGLFATRLERALSEAGFTGPSYYRFRDGFVMLAQIEQTDSAGKSLPAPDRWAAKVPPMRDFDLSRYLKELFSARVGYYRLIGFVVTAPPFQFGKEPFTEKQAKSLYEDGYTSLEPDIAAKKVTSESKCYVMVYEFRKETESEDPRVATNPTATGKEHLVLSGIYSGFGK